MQLKGCFRCLAVIFVFFSFCKPPVHSASRYEIEEKYKSYQQALDAVDNVQIVTTGEAFLAAAIEGELSYAGRLKQDFQKDPVGTTLFKGSLLAMGGVIALPMSLLNVLERGGKSSRELLPNTNHKGLDVLLSKREQRNFWAEMGDAYFAQKNFPKAAWAYVRFIELEESFRLTLAREDRRIGYFSNYQHRLDRLLSSLFATGKFEKALIYMELGKAKTLRESFLNSQIRQLEQQSIRKALLVKAQIETTMQKEAFSRDELRALQRSIELLCSKRYRLYSGLARPKNCCCNAGVDSPGRTGK